LVVKSDVYPPLKPYDVLARKPSNASTASTKSL
jgi:hypothetical protein